MKYLVSKGKRGLALNVSDLLAAEDFVAESFNAKRRINFDIMIQSQTRQDRVFLECDVVSDPQKNTCAPKIFYEAMMKRGYYGFIHGSWIAFYRTDDVDIIGD